MSHLEIKGFVPGSVLWIKTQYPLNFVNGLSKEMKQVLTRDFFTLVTPPHITIEELTAEHLKAAGLRKIPRLVNEPKSGA